MSNFDKTRAALIKRFIDAWPAVAPASLPLSLIGLPNKTFSHPSSGIYGRLSIQQGERYSAAIGAARIRSIGVVYLQIFIPEGGGTKPGTDAGDAMAAVFDNRTIALLDATGFIRMGFAMSDGAISREGYEQHNYSAAYQQDENRD